MLRSNPFYLLPLICMLGICHLSSSLVSAQTPSIAAVPDWIRGSGDQLELHLSGQILRKDGGSIEGAHVEITMQCSDAACDVFRSKIDDAKFHVWLPVNSRNWYRLVVNVTCRDGARFTQIIYRHQLRELVINGLNIEVQLPTKKIEVVVKHGESEVADAIVRAELTNGLVLRSQASSIGVASFNLLESDELQQLTAWSVQKLIGGHQFSRKPTRDPRADKHEIGMYPCETLKVHLKDEHGQPIKGVPIELNVATPPPEHNYLGLPDDCNSLTNQDGTASIDCFPCIENAHIESKLLDNHWILKSSQRENNNLEIVASEATARQQMMGRVSNPQEFTGGLNVKMGSFQSEQAHMTDFVYRFTDPDGKFIASVLPDATYAIFLEDDRWVAEATHLIPFVSKTQKLNSVELSMYEGIPVRIHLTQGSNRRPIPNLWVGISSGHRFKWLENGKSHSGVLARFGGAFADINGVIETRVPEGELGVNVFLPDWRTQQKMDVQRGQRNEMQIHRKIDEVSSITGKIILWNESHQRGARANVHLKAIDGECDDEFRLEADEQGRFQIQTKATKLGGIAYSPDKQYVGTIVIKDVAQSAEITLFPVKSFAGQIIDQEGKPVTNHKVYASIAIGDERKFNTAYSTTFFAPAIEGYTDKEGKYQLDGIPCKTKVSISTDTLDRELQRFESIDQIYFLPEEGPRQRVSRIGKTKPRASNLPLSHRFASMLRDCKLGSYHLMIVVYDKSIESTTKFVNDELLNNSESNLVSSFMQLQIDPQEFNSAENIAFAEQLALIRSTQKIHACAYDGEGKELGRILLDPEATNAEAKATRHFIERFAPSPEDAEMKWNMAFQQAKEQNKRVWVRTGQRYCGPCFLLSRWIDDHRDVLEKEFVMIKIDGVRDLKGGQFEERLARGRLVGVPFFAFFDRDQKLITDSYSSIGNIGFMSGTEGKRHFEMMLETARVKISSEEVQALLSTLED